MFAWRGRPSDHTSGTGIVMDHDNTIKPLTMGSQYDSKPFIMAFY